MENFIDDLIKKQQLVAKYLTQNYEIVYDVDKAKWEFKDKCDGKVGYGNEIIDDIKLFYSLGSHVVNTVVDEWIKPTGLSRNDRTAWTKPPKPYEANFGDGMHQAEYRPRDIDDGPMRLETTYTEDTLRRLQGDRRAEEEIVRRLANQIIIELADERAAQSLHRCVSFRGLEETMHRLGFERIELIDPTMMIRTFRWVESPRAWERRRSEYYHRRRRDEHLDLERQRLEYQRNLIERNHYEEAHRRQAEEEIRRRQEYERERARYERDRDHYGGGSYIL